MQEDKKLKELLQKWAVENPSADFNNQVMQRVTSAYTVKTHTQSLLTQRLPQILLGIFILVCMVLLVLSFIVPATAFPFQLTIVFPAKYFSQSLQFMVVFWIVMLLNLVSKRYAAKAL